MTRRPGRGAALVLPVSFLGSRHTVLLPNGKVLGVFEGSPWDYGDLVAELYDPATGQWSNAGHISIFWAPP